MGTFECSVNKNSIVLLSQPWEVQDAVNKVMRNGESRAKAGEEVVDSEDGVKTIPISTKGDIFMLGLVIFRLLTVSQL